MPNSNSRHPSFVSNRVAGGATDFKKSAPTTDAGQIDFTALTHPEYDKMIFDWERYRCTFKSGEDFLEKYLVKFSNRESDEDFKDRKCITYIPSHARTAVLEIRNAIFKRMVDISRNGGSDTYRESIYGENKGVDKLGSSMNSFMGTKVLTELMTMTRVGVYIDKPPIPEGATLADRESLNLKPYLYIYQAEDIRSWGFDSETGSLRSVLLRDYRYIYNDETGLPLGIEPFYRFMIKRDGFVEVKIYDKDNLIVETYVLDLPEIPFVIGELNESILTDVVRHQIALLNLGSGDMNYATKSNYPFYVEQIDPQAEFLNNLTGADLESDGTTDGTTATANTSRSKSVKVGVAQGRGYARGLDAPKFISPDTGPLEASMKKQESIKQEIRELVSLSVAGLSEEGGLEAGLAYLGLQLESMERSIGRIWSYYEGEGDKVPSIAYPNDYQVKGNAERIEDAKGLLYFVDKVPSLQYQKTIAKEVVSKTLGHKVSSEELDEIYKEIDDSKVVVIDPNVLAQDIENGLVDTLTAGIARGYSPEAVKKAMLERLEKANMIAMAQSGRSGEPVNAATGGSRGVDDAGVDPKADAKEEKDISQKQAKSVDQKSRTRGEDKRPRKTS